MAVSQENELRRLRKQVERLEGELRWYEDERNYEPVEGVWTEGNRTVAGTYVPVLADRGRKAKEALG